MRWKTPSNSANSSSAEYDQWQSSPFTSLRDAVNARHKRGNSTAVLREVDATGVTSYRVGVTKSIALDNAPVGSCAARGTYQNGFQRETEGSEERQGHDKAKTVSDLGREVAGRWGSENTRWMLHRAIEVT